MKKAKRACAFLLSFCLAFLSVCTAGQAQMENGEKLWRFGFAKREIVPNFENGPLYIAGYNSGWEVSDVLDYCQARAVWLEAGGEGVLLIGVDAVALDSGTVREIREGLSDIENCASINVYSTHTHAGIDTLGLWGPVAVNGKNDEYMKSVIQAAVEAGREAAENLKDARMYLGQADTGDMCYDSREPEVYDPNLYQLRLEDPSGGAGLRMFFFGAHAESLRGSNSKLSRDFPGILCDLVTESTGDDTMFFPGAIGGLIMTREYVHNTTVNAVRNLNLTGEKLTEIALSIKTDTESVIEPDMVISCQKLTVPLENTAFLLYKFLGILQSQAVRAEGGSGYAVETELSVLMLGDLAITLIPGEIFPELVWGGEYGDANPEGVNPPALMETAKEYGVEKMLIIGLANDEIGYIVPPSDFLVNEKAPYIEKTMDLKGENHYEETNSVGPECAEKIHQAFKAALEELQN